MNKKGDWKIDMYIVIQIFHIKFVSLKKSFQLDAILLSKLTPLFLL